MEWSWWRVSPKQGEPWSKLVELVESLGGELWRCNSDARYVYLLHLERARRASPMVKYLKEWSFFEPAEPKEAKQERASLVYSSLHQEERRAARRRAYRLHREKGRHKYSRGEQKEFTTQINIHIN